MKTLIGKEANYSLNNNENFRKESNRILSFSSHRTKYLKHFLNSYRVTLFIIYTH
jgi:hypothetical protein